MGRKGKNPELVKSIYDYINHCIRYDHHVPSQNEIAAAMNVSSPTAYNYLKYMSEAGMITYDHKLIGTDMSEKCSSDYISIPIVGSIECGNPETETAYVEEYVSLPASIFGKGKFYILHAEGTSMVDAGIYPGDLVVIRKQETAEIGDIVVALDDFNQNTLKRYGGQDPDTGKAVLLYQNKAEYPGKRILVDGLVIQGVAKKNIRNIRNL